MTMTPSLRKGALTAHVVASVGWLGAVACSLVLALAALRSDEEQVIRSAYLMMDLVARVALVPLSLASLVTGIVQSLGTRWGLLRHHWVVAKLLINLAASLVLLLYLQTLDALAELARSSATRAGALENPSPLLHAGAALVVLVLATVLSVFKPKGVTRYGQRRQARTLVAREATSPCDLQRTSVDERVP